MAEAGEVVVVPADVFRSKVLTDVRLSDTVLEAFLARRTALLSSAADTLQIVGSEYTPASMALREYAVRNRSPTTGSTRTTTTMSPPSSRASA